MTINCPICIKEHRLPSHFKTHVPIIQTCDFCKFEIFIYKKASGEIYTDDAECREKSLSIYGKECIIKAQLEEIEDALFIPKDPLSEKYKNVDEKTLLKKQEELEEQHNLLRNERHKEYDKFNERWSKWSEKYFNHND